MTHSEQPIRVRIAPSPTGNLHVGTARTALFNYLFAKKHGGQFILRVEDTDRERSLAQYEKNIFESLLALGLTWDEGPNATGSGDIGNHGPYRQSERTELYQQWAKKLLEAGLAYECYLTSEELAEETQKAQAENRTYNSRCRDAEVRAELSKDPTRKASIRFRIPDNRGNISWQDAVREELSFDSALMSDFVMLKSDGTPSYNFAVVIDDWLMKISHVIRGEDHISNTPKQIVIYEALQTLAPSIQIPIFAHVSMILAPDRSKLSKRHGATAVSEFIKQGYLPEAFCNFLTLLGWTPPSGEEIGTLEEFAKEFTLEKLSTSGAIFDQEKLNSTNGKWLRKMDINEFVEHAKPYLHAFDLSQYCDDKLKLILNAVRERIHLLSELPEWVIYFFGQKVMLDAKLLGENLSSEEAQATLQSFQSDFLNSADFSTQESIHDQFKAWLETQKPIKTKVVMQALRTALTGRTSGIDLSLTLYILGKDIIEARTETALNLMSAKAI